MVFIETSEILFLPKMPKISPATYPIQPGPAIIFDAITISTVPIPLFPLP